MRACLFAVALSLLPGLPAAAQQATMRALQTTDDGKGWEAVGRIELGDRGFCTGALIADDLVLTAAHCLFDKETGARIADRDIEFLERLADNLGTSIESARYRQRLQEVLAETQQLNEELQVQQEELKTALTTQRQQYEQLARPLDEEIRTRQAEERNKVLALIKTAIDVVAEREKFDLVLNSGAAVYAKPEYDISEAVITQVSKAK